MIYKIEEIAHKRGIILQAGKKPEEFKFKR